MWSGFHKIETQFSTKFPVHTSHTQLVQCIDCIDYVYSLIDLWSSGNILSIYQILVCDRHSIVIHQETTSIAESMMYVNVCHYDA